MPLLLIAGLIEGFVSPTGLDPPTKFAIGAAMFVLLAAYLGLRAGSRGRPAGTETSAVAPRRLQRVPFLDRQVALDDRRGDVGGREIQRQRTAPPQAAQQRLAPIEHFLRRQHAIQIGRRRRRRAASAATSICRSIAHSTRWRSAIRLAHSITSGTPAVSARSVSQTISERRCCVPQQRRGGRGMIAFDRFGPRLRQHLEQAAQVPRAAIGRDARVHAAPVGDQADAIAGRLRDVRQRQRRVDGGVELGAIAGPRAQQPAAVEQDPDGLAALRADRAG